MLQVENGLNFKEIFNSDSLFIKTDSKRVIPEETFGITFAFGIILLKKSLVKKR